MFVGEVADADIDLMCMFINVLLDLFCVVCICGNCVYNELPLGTCALAPIFTCADIAPYITR